MKVGRKFENPVPTAVGGLSIMLKVLPLYVVNREERTPRVAPGPFRTDASIYRTEPLSGLRATWFGHSSALLEIDGVRVLMDPVWDERASPVQWFGPKRFFPPTMALDELPPLDAVILSHDHYDHLGAGTVKILARLHPEMRWVAPLGIGGELRKFGVAPSRITELDWTQSTVIYRRDNGAELAVTAVPTRHFSGRSAFNRFETLWSSYALRGSAHAVYFGADSGEWEGFGEIGAMYGPFDLTMLEIGAFHELWKDIHMGPAGAARSFAAMGGQGLLMPMHWGLFDLALHSWRTPIREMLELAGQQGLRLWSPEPGRPTEVTAGVEVRSTWWQGEGG
ncbi:L-ascorbate metabolism protein UlaG, beta-lactamase superfamily [Granulicella rosea]|uniref:L-ascorbate metabolism protein UlaG, beta-lactamase superfamily n=2 Tax=Granulicella rosea TaxID=474952 RepID=A0A239HRD1_9BACT|nr:L-ascorbate metabolism protein UlaG, beta-lactamase superfamily [Granulicella rosea]